MSGEAVAAPRSAAGFWLALLGVTFLGLLVRAIPVALADWPVNDGGLFVAMTRAIENANWALPATVAWNGTDLPFIYPPLAFYKAGLLESVFGFDIYEVFRWLPLVWSTLVVPAVYLLARELLRSAIGGLVAALAYALFPVSYVWLVQGGGITRAPGMLLAVLTLWLAVRLVRDPSTRRGVTVGLLAGLTALVHPGSAVFVAFSSVLIWLFEGRSRAAAIAGAGALGTAALAITPWAVLVIERHGMGAIAGVPSNGPEPALAILAVFAGRVTGTPVTDPIAIIGLALAILCVIRRRYLLPVWFGISVFLSFQYGMVPFAILIGYGAVDLLSLRATRPRDEAGQRRSGRLLGWVPTIGFATLGVALALEAVASALTVYNPGAPVHALTPDRREAMDWVASELALDARVAVLTYNGWSSDPDSEWFPLLAERVSVATVQGSELLGTEAFEDQVRAHQFLQECVQNGSVSCVEEFLDTWPANYVYIPNGPLYGPSSPPDCCAELRRALAEDDRFELAHESAGATIFAVRDSESAASVSR